MANWKTQGRGAVQDFQIKMLKNLHERTAFPLNKISNVNEQLADWLTYGRTVLCQKDRTKGNKVDSYRPISCLLLLWKFLTGIISQYLYRFLEEKILPEE